MDLSSLAHPVYLFWMKQYDKFVIHVLHRGGAGVQFVLVKIFDSAFIYFQVEFMEACMEEAQKYLAYNALDSGYNIP